MTGPSLGSQNFYTTDFYCTVFFSRLQFWCNQSGFTIVYFPKSFVTNVTVFMYIWEACEIILGQIL